MKKARYRGIPCYFDESSGDLEGRNLFYDILVHINVWIDVNIACVESFEIEIEE